MSIQRKISWSAALRDLKSDRIDAVAAKAYREAKHAADIKAMRAKSGAKIGTWTPATGFDRRAIMAHAVKVAQAEMINARARRSPRPWVECMSEGLKYAWATAHAARRAAAH